MLTYAYCTTLTPKDKLLYEKCHTFHNNLYNDVFEILKNILGNIYGIPHIRMFPIRKLSIHELSMVRDLLLPVGLDLDIDYKAYPGLINHKLFSPPISFRNQIKYPKFIPQLTTYVTIILYFISILFILIVQYNSLYIILISI